MTMPGFTAEESLYRTHRRYYYTQSNVLVNRQVVLSVSCEYYEFGGEVSVCCCSDDFVHCECTGIV